MSSSILAARSTYDIIDNGTSGNINNNNGDFNTNNNGDADDSSVGVVQGMLNDATKTMYAVSIITLVFIAIQAILFCTFLGIWLHKRNQRRRRERQKTEEQDGVAEYRRPTVGYWGLPSSEQQQMGMQTQYNQSLWHDVSHSTSPIRFATTRREMSA
ncbi:hypothetical protein F5Y09DRAFT_338820 [Xylaria sp. FL1042]|nr:hypothetical protein F5Y09DRAFT_338820 [Xylaria sp. FL1042]